MGIFNGEIVGWLENENRMGLLCEARPGSAEHHACRAEHLEPRVLVVPVRAGPERDATRLGELVLVARPGRGLRIHASAGGVVEPFTPDLFLEDWGYGPPYFHQTILERSGSRFRVPLPVMGAGWIDAADWLGGDGEGVHVEVLQRDGSVITTPHGDVVLEGIENGVLRLRPETEADMWCRTGDPPQVDPPPEVRVPIAELYGPGGHLLLTYKYMKGC